MRKLPEVIERYNSDEHGNQERKKEKEKEIKKYDITAIRDHFTSPRTKIKLNSTSEETREDTI